jgi:hypothetical protein
MAETGPCQPGAAMRELSVVPMHTTPAVVRPATAHLQPRCRALCLSSTSDMGRMSRQGGWDCDTWEKCAQGEGGGRSDARLKRMGCPAARARGGVVEEGV